MAFTATLLVEGDSFSGRIIEPRTLGEPTSDLLYSEVLGRINRDRTVIFIKKYDGTAGVSHAVLYVGSLDARSGKISGRWQIDTASGKFVMGPRQR